MNKTDLEIAMKAIMTAKSAETDCPSPDELLSYRDGLLAHEERDELLERAAVSPEVAGALLDTNRFPDVEPADGHPVTEEDTAHQWRRFQQRLHQETQAQETQAQETQVRSHEIPPVRPTPIWSFFNSLRFAQAAAALLLVSLSLSWAFALQRPLRDDSRPSLNQPSLNRPSLNLPIVNLVPESVSGERAAARSVRVPNGSDGLIVVLALSERRSYPSYEVTIRDAADEAVWTSTALQQLDGGIFTLQLPREFLAMGRYRVVLRGIDDGERREPLAVYNLAIEG